MLNTEKLKQQLIDLPRFYKRMLQIGIDVILIWLALCLAFIFRLGIELAYETLQAHAWLFIAAPLIAIPVFYVIGLYKAVVRFAGKEVFAKAVQSTTVSALLLVLIVYWFGTDAKPVIPRSFALTYWLISMMIIAGSRSLVRQFFSGDWLETGQIFVPFLKYDDRLPRVAIYGAGSAGNQLLNALRQGKTMHPVAFIDDDKNLQGRVVAGLKVYSSNDIGHLLRDAPIKQVLLALPKVSRARRKEILQNLEPYPVHVLTVPDFMDLASGRVKVQELQEVDIADLLGRDPVEPHQDLFEQCIREQIVMVTGAGGSIGSELCRQIVDNAPQTLVLFEHSEYNLYQIHQELEHVIKQRALSIRIVPMLGSVRDFAKLVETMRLWQVDTIYHAAAYKHVPLVEYNVSEGVLNNSFGTLATAEAAIVGEVKNFVLISTDKAVRPTNVMGCSKRLAELILQALSKEQQHRLFSAPNDTTEYVNKTRFTMVRFGNVLGSSGSVIPLFREQIKNGGPVTVTHPNITRYFMTIPEAAQLVIQAGSMGQGGDVFVLDMGEPVRIAELAEKMILLSGFTVRSDSNPTGEIAIDFVGLRPGEKLYEELLIGDDVIETAHSKIMSANEIMLDWQTLTAILHELQSLVEQRDCLSIRKVLRQAVPGYQPQGDVADCVHDKKAVASV